MAPGIQPLQVASDVLRPFGFKNLIINGAHDFWQRGTSFTCTFGVGNQTSLTADRFKAAWNFATTGTYVVSQETSILPDATVGSCLKVACTAIHAAFAAAEYAFVQQIVEGYNIKAVSQSKVTLSFWVRSNKTGTYCAAFTDSAGTRTWVSEYTINSANTWEKKTVTIDLSVGTASGTWLYTNGIGLHVTFTLACGSGRQTTKDAWQNGNYQATSSQVNFMDTNTNVLYISKVQLEKGDTATDFEIRTYEQELGLCQRYYEKSYDLGTVPGTIASAGAAYGRQVLANQQSYATLSKQFVVRKRTTGVVVTFYSDATGTAARFRDQTAGADRTVTGFGGTGETVTGYPNLGAGAGAAGDFISAQWTAEAEL